MKHSYRLKPLHAYIPSYNIGCSLKIPCTQKRCAFVSPHKCFFWCMDAAYGKFALKMFINHHVLKKKLKICFSEKVIWDPFVLKLPVQLPAISFCGTSFNYFYLVPVSSIWFHLVPSFSTYAYFLLLVNLCFLFSINMDVMNKTFYW